MHKLIDEITQMHTYHKKELLKSLSYTTNEQFLHLLWSGNILQTENSKWGLKYLIPETVPAAAVGAELPNPNAIYKWELEVLANEVLTTSKALKRGEKRLDPRNFQALTAIANRLRKLENKEYNIGGRRKDIFLELARIGHRQFPWQTGFVNIANLYRYVFVYGQGACAQAFEELHEVSIADFTQVCFALYSHFMTEPVFHGLRGMEAIGISSGQLKAALVPLAAPIVEARRKAVEERKNVMHIAFKPSIYRRTPCIDFGHGNDIKLRAPMPQLLIDRMTAGLFYDVVQGGDAARQEYGRRFEEYCLEFCRGTLDTFNWQPEHQYRFRGNRHHSPDLFCFDNQEAICVIECKATRLSWNAMYGGEPLKDRGYTDLVKAVKQIWKCFAHSRLGALNVTFRPDACGVVLTLDGWLTMAHSLSDKILQTAREEISHEAPYVEYVDMRPVHFTPIENLERVLSGATAQSFRDVLKAAGTPKYDGWHLDMVHKELPSFDSSVDRPNPFSERVGELLPWWGNLSRMGEIDSSVK